MSFSGKMNRRWMLGILTVLSTIVATDSQISTSCTSSMVATFTPCLNYVTGSGVRGSSPTQDCCNSLKSLMSDGVDCGCLIVTGNVPLSIPYVNRNLAISLPRMCRTSVPIQCKASGDPLPAPGPALFGPTSAPSAYAPSGQEEEGAGVDAAESPAGGLDVAPAAPPETPEDLPEQQPGVRPVVDPNSSPPNGSIDTSSNLVRMLLGIAVLIKFL
ncbi:non-specific lipid transfer protein GPI-anchored 16-like [Andrographis paniculata]|uniref:non-specific lipid transfer protein GPI-anchored 16-like n=1 Tax=Andrographis paniculata TaxID=175694 RepID=UPI0021E6F950|nr:non-specific lipid transfer protein GPI-anchored 16-like [Andrographis paniculata]